MAGVDTAWLRMEQPTNLMMIVGVLRLERPLALATLRGVIGQRFLAYERFRSRAVLDDGAGYWEDDPAFALERHVVRERAPGRGEAGLQALVSRLASTPLPADRPRWCFHLVERHDGGSAVVVRIHHCYADGIALIRVLLSMTGDSAASSLARGKPAPRTSAATPAPAADVLAEWTAWLSEVARPATMQALGRKAAAVAGDLAGLALMGGDAATPLKGPLGRAKRAAWAEPFPLDEVKAVGQALGCSINDVLLALAAGALRRYVAARGGQLAGRDVRVLVPVNLRGEDAGEPLGNRFGLVFLELPVTLDHPLARLYEVHRRMRALRDSTQPALVLALLNAVGAGPDALQQQVTALLGRSASAVMTNVPGPREPRYLAGARIVALDFWVPQSGGIGLGLSILSYAGRIHFGVVADAGRVPDPAAIVDAFAEEYQALLWVALMSPWLGEAAPS